MPPNSFPAAENAKTVYETTRTVELYLSRLVRLVANLLECKVVILIDKNGCREKRKMMQFMFKTLKLNITFLTLPKTL